MQIDKADVVVVGGGTVGVSTAHFLAARGHDVVLVEQREIAYGASGRNMGFLHMHNRNSGYALELSRAGRALYDDFSALLGPSFEFRANGAMTFFHTDDQRRVYAEFVESRNRQGFRLELLDEQAAHEAAPILPDDVIGATFNPEDGQIMTPKFVRALAQECRRQGVRIHEQTPVVGLLREGERVVGVRTVDGDIPAGHVVWCTGAWSNVLTGEGIDVPIRPERLGAVMLAPVEARLDKILNGPLSAKQYAHIRDLPSYRDEYFTAPEEDPERGIEFLECIAKTENGNLFVGCPMDYPDTMDHRMPIEGLRMVVDSLLRTFPQYRTLGVEAAWTGIIPATADSLPIVDRVPDAPGLVLSTGHVYGNLAGPISGKLVAQLLSDEALDLTLDPLAYGRDSLALVDGAPIRW